MSQPLTKKTTDHSDENSFSFSFFCDLCGREWKSHVIPFENEGITAIDNTAAQQRIWADEHRIAFNEANVEARSHFNKCPKCGKWVCDDCLPLDNGQEGFLCRECTARNNEGTTPHSGSKY